MGERQYSFSLEKISVKERNLIYQERGCHLVLYLEASGLPAYDWVGTYASFQPVSDQRRAEILRRLAELANEQGIRIHIGPAMTAEDIAKLTEKFRGKRPT